MPVTGNALSLAEAARAHRSNIQLSKNKNPIKGQGVLPCLLVYLFTVYCLVTSNLQTNRYTVQITLNTWNHWTSAVPSDVPVPLVGSVQLVSSG